jgi:hypothetical protein
MADRVMHVHDGLISGVHENAVKKQARELSW